MNTTLAKQLINHCALVLDRSGSMNRHARKVVEVADAHVQSLATLSTTMGQETRITIYLFDDTVECVCYDKDVLRLPSLADFYRIRGNTALLDATHQAINDLDLTAQLYGDHAFLVHVVTDGEENKSHITPATLKQRIGGLNDGWTLATLVPNSTASRYAVNIGFPPGNIQEWDTNSLTGFEDVGRAIYASTQSYMTQRAAGIRSTHGLFTLDTQNLTKSVVQQLDRLSRGEYHLYYVNATDALVIADFVESKTHRPYRKGEAYYEITKPEEIQPQKKVVLVDGGGNAFTGREARRLLGLPDFHIKVNPSHHPLYTIFIQSTSSNRKLVAGTRVLLFDE